MTVAELIVQLQSFPPDARVVVPHFNGGLDDLVRLYTLPIQLGKQEFFGKGTHLGPPIDPIEDRAFTPDETALVLDWSPYGTTEEIA